MANVTGFHYTKDFSKEDKECSDYCPHVSHKKLKHAVGYFYERDSFGPVQQYIVCEACRVKCQDQEDNKQVLCHDCNLTVLAKDAIRWKWYDFYAAQGDEPLTICSCCQKADKHIQRVKRDRADYEYEFPQHNQYADDDDDGYTGYDDSPDDDMLDEEEDVPDEHWDDLK